MRTTFIIFASVIALGVSGQDLSTEITGDRTIVPKRETSHPLQSVRPALLGTEVPEVHLSPDELGEIPPYEPQPGFSEAVGPELPAVSPFRGYISGGYLPSHNYAAQAGYGIVSTDRTHLDLHLGLHGYSSRADRYDDASKASLLMPELRITAFHKFRTHTLLEIQAGGSYDRLNLEYSGTDKQNRDVLRGWFNGRFTTSANEHKIALNLTGRHIGASSGYEGIPRGESSILGLSGSITPIGKTGWEGTLGAEVQRRQGFTGIEGYLRQTCAIFHIHPGYIIGLGSMVNLRAGVRLDLTAGGDDSGLHFAPEITLTADPFRWLHLCADFTGGERFNTQERLYAYSPFITGSYLFRNSYTPVDARLSLTLGPWDMGKFTVYGRYSRTNEVPMPFYTPEGLTWGTVDLQGFSAGVDFEFTPLSWIKLKAGASMLPHSYTGGIASDIDRARFVVKTSLTVTPHKNIEVGMGFDLRTEREMYDMTPGQYFTIDLGDLSDLRFHAVWHASASLSVFTTLNNILNQHPDLVPDFNVRGIHGLVGAIYKF